MKLKTYHYFWIVALIILVIGLKDFNNPDATADINIHDTYFVIHQFHFAVFIFSCYYLLGVGYWSVEKVLKKRLIKALTLIHTVILIGSFAIYWIVVFYANLFMQNSFPLVDNNEMINSVLLASFCAIIFIAQPIYIINILIGIFKKSSGRSAKTR